VINITFFAIGELGGGYLEVYNISCVCTGILYAHVAPLTELVIGILKTILLLALVVSMLELVKS
jgi:hypothetical protein